MRYKSLECTIRQAQGDKSVFCQDHHNSHHKILDRIIACNISTGHKNECSFIAGDFLMTTSDKRADIIQAALELIAERGFHDAPMSEIPEKAQVAAGTIYRYFENKDVLINDLFQNIEDRLMDVLLTNYPERNPVKEKFTYVFGELCRYFLKNPLHFRYMEQFFNSPYGISKRREKLSGKIINQVKRDPLKEIFNEGVSQRILKDLPVSVLSSLAIGPLLYVLRDHTLGFVLLDEALIGQITEACWDAIKIDEIEVCNEKK